MQDSAILSPERPSRWSIVPAAAAGGLTLLIFYVAGFIFPVFWEWRITGFMAIVFMGIATGCIAPRGRQWLTYGMLAALIGLFATEVSWILARDGYLLIRYARPRRIAYNNSDPGWILLTPGQRAAGLTYVALQRKATDPAEAKRIFKKALHAASQIATDNHAVLFGIAQGQVKAGFFEDAEATILLIEDPIQWDLHYGLIAVEMARHGGRSHGQRLFEQAIQAAQRDPDKSRRDRDLYLIGYRQWEGGMFDEARRTAELIQTADSKADLLDRLNDSAQLEVARQQAGSGRFGDAEGTIKKYVKDPYRYCDGLINVATAAATNAQTGDARRIFDHALNSAKQIESPSGSNSVMADIALRQLELGFSAESQKTLAFITDSAIKSELLRKLARAKALPGAAKSG